MKSSQPSENISASLFHNYSKLNLSTQRDMIHLLSLFLCVCQHSLKMISVVLSCKEMELFSIYAHTLRKLWRIKFYSTFLLYKRLWLCWLNLLRMTDQGLIWTDYFSLNEIVETNTWGLFMTILKAKENQRRNKIFNIQSVRKLYKFSHWIKGYANNDIILLIFSIHFNIIN